MAAGRSVTLGRPALDFRAGEPHLTRNPRSSRVTRYHEKLAEQRSERRTVSKFSVWIKGADAHGVGFHERVRSVDASQHGIALLTQRDLSHSAILTVNIPGLGSRRADGGRADFRAQALVAYVLPEGDLNRVGLRFIGATLAP